MRLFHTNDIHSEYENMGRLATFLRENKKANDLYIDAGDISDLKSLMVIGSKGLVSARFMNELNVDAVAVGNNESELGKEWLENMAGAMPLVCCNLKTTENEDIKNLLPSKIITKDGTRFLIVGTSPFYSADLREGAYNFFLELDGLKTIDPIIAIQKEIKRNHGNYDICILASHSGIETDEYIAKSVEGIDILVGGHSHSLIEQPLVINNTIMIQARAYAEFVGCLDLTIQDNKIIDYKYSLNTLNKFRQDEDFQMLLEECNENAIEQLNEPIATIEELAFDLTHECRLINFICDALYLMHPCDLAIMYNGIANYTLVGDISKIELIDCLPSKLNPTLVHVSGKQIRDAFELSFDENYCMQSGKGPGFRGDKLGTLSFSHNVSIVDSKLYINNELLDDDKEYSVMLDDYLQRGQRYSSLKTEEKDAKFFSGFIRDLIERNLTNKECFELSLINRGK
ncbi:bifunctional metallophosphatase/5'-nucleotidase [Anaerorhabdus sp.]|jgi:5'-nucleotidase|uniref:bifunctional metallophosphatase/5'-nucleotidase n=1 Tax=Anaerorhabdus sp. TaxID=1872524 RepID=UPI002FCBD63D